METSSNNNITGWLTLLSTILFSIAYAGVYIIAGADFGRKTTVMSFLALGVMGIVTIIITLLYFRNNRNHDPLSARIDSVCSRYTLFLVLISVVPLLIELLGYQLIPGFYELADEYPARFSFSVTVLALYVIAYPLLHLSLRKIPKLTIRPHKMGLGVFAACVAMMAGLAFTGTLIGTPIDYVLTHPFADEDTTNLTKIIMSSTLFERILVTAVLAPIFEELIFRKILIDRTIKYGQTLSIIMSGLLFGLFHGNFQQFFFAALIGMLFALVYIRTGRIRYTIFLHATMNLSSSLVSASLLILIYPYLEDDLKNVPADILMMIFVFFMWIFILFSIAVTGIVMLIVWRKRLIPYKAPEEPRTGELISSLLRSPLFWSCITITAAHFASNYLPDIVDYCL